MIFSAVFDLSNCHGNGYTGLMSIKHQCTLFYLFGKLSVVFTNIHNAIFVFTVFLYKCLW